MVDSGSLRSTPWRVLLGAVAAALVAATVGATPARSPFEPAAAKVVVLVTGGGGSAGVKAAAEALGGRVTRDLPLVGGFAATVPAGASVPLRAVPGVRSVTPDGTVTVATHHLG